MKRLALATVAALALLLSHDTAKAQAVTVVSDCSTVSGMAVGPGQPLVEDTTGKLCGLSGTGAITIDPVVVTPTDKSGTVTAGGTAQTAIAANPSRKGWCIQNPPTATENLQVRSGAAATSTTGVALVPGQGACNPTGEIDQGIISVIGATTSHAYLGIEYQ